MLLAVFFFAVMDATLKALTAHYAPIQTAALRGLAPLPLVIAYITWRRRWGTLRHIRWPLHLLRGGLGIVMLTLFVMGLRSLPMSAAYTLFFIGPLLITVLSIPILGERVPPVHWIALAIGFAGVLVALQPTGERGWSDFPALLVSGGGLAVLGAAFCYAIVSLCSRLISRTDSSESLVLSMTGLMAVGATVLALPEWAPLRADDLGLIALLGLSGFLGQVAITEAFRWGQASLIAPLEYTALAWSAAFDLLIWRHLPGSSTWWGASLIVCAGVLMMWHEQRTPPPSPPPSPSR